MPKHIQHTARLLLLVIAYPFIFQSLHIITHDHRHDDLNTGSCGHTALNSCLPSAGNCSSGHFIHVANKNCELKSGSSDCRDTSGFFSTETTGHKHEDCPLCEHEFAKFSFIKVNEIFFTFESVSRVNAGNYTSPVISYTGNHTSLRAPPGIV